MTYEESRALDADVAEIDRLKTENAEKQTRILSLESRVANQRQELNRLGPQVQNISMIYLAYRNLAMRLGQSPSIEDFNGAKEELDERSALYAENERLKEENAKLRHHLSPPSSSEFVPDDVNDPHEAD